MYSEWYVIHQVNVTITPLGGTIMYNDRGIYAGLHTGFFYGGGGGGGTHISAASRGSGGMLPHKIFCILR